jgi:archaetidylinositol phosphate synthase
MTEKSEFKDAARAQQSLLAPLEKKVLIWLARRMPAGVNSDHLTLLGLLGMLLAGLGYWWSRSQPLALWGVNVALAVNWFGDSLDGTLARVRNRLRPRYGFYVDHVVDEFGTFFLLGGLALSGYMSPWVATGVLMAYFMLNIEVYLATYSLGTFHLSHFKLSPTELRILLAIGNVVLLVKPRVHLGGREFLLFDVGGVIGIAGMGVMLLTAVVKHTVALYKAERLP